MFVYFFFLKGWLYSERIWLHKCLFIVLHVVILQVLILIRSFSYILVRQFQPSVSAISLNTINIVVLPGSDHQYTQLGPNLSVISGELRENGTGWGVLLPTILTENPTCFCYCFYCLQDQGHGVVLFFIGRDEMPYFTRAHGGKQFFFSSLSINPTN